MMSATTPDGRLLSSVAVDRLKIHDTGDVLYVGYMLPLSPTQVEILRLLQAHAAEVPDGYLSREAIRHALQPSTDTHDPEDSTPTTRQMSDAQLSVQIGRINRRARAVGGRELILCKRFVGYRLNPYL